MTVAAKRLRGDLPDLPCGAILRISAIMINRASCPYPEHMSRLTLLFAQPIRLCEGRRKLRRLTGLLTPYSGHRGTALDAKGTYALTVVPFFGMPSEDWGADTERDFTEVGRGPISRRSPTCVRVLKIV